MREMLCETWRLFYILFRRILGITTIVIPTVMPAPEESREDITKCCELLSLVHEELGVHKWCGHGNGIILVNRIDLREIIGIDDGSILKIQYRRIGPGDYTMHVLSLWYFRIGNHHLTSADLE